MKSAFASAGLSQVPYVALHASELEDANSRSALLNRIETELNYPCFVKPANLGSSVGISKVRSRQELEEGLNQAAALDPRTRGGAGRQRPRGGMRRPGEDACSKRR